MDVPTLDRHIIDWDEADVHTWLSKLGYPQYDGQIREHKIRGDVLISIDSENLKLLGVSSIGQRLAILKAIYFAKVAYGIPRDDDSYVPPSESSERANRPSFGRLQSSMEDQARRLRSLEDENRQLNSIVQALIDDFNGLRTSFAKTDDVSSPLARQPSFKWAQFVKPQKSPTKADAVDSPRLSPQNLENDSPSQTRNNSHPPQPPEKLRNQTNDPPNPIQPPRDKPHRQESTDNLKSFKVSLDDPTWKVLPAALKKYRITNDTWQNYAMFICFGPPGNRVERCLSYDEKPLLLFQKLKDAQKNPVFMLKHIKDIRSPIAVAQQKHAARKASSVAPTPSTNTHSKQPSTSRSAPRPPKLEVQDLSAPTPIQSSLTSPQAGWPETGLASPAVEKNADRLPSVYPSIQPPGSAVSGTTIIGSDTSIGTAIAPTTAIDSSASRMDTTEQPQHQQATTPKDMSGVSYAVAIYPYMAEQEDEFDVVVGDTFVILSRQRGWWIVQRDLTGSGVVDADTKQGWVPAGCLLETNVPVASAIAEATAAKGNSADGTNKTPILPLSIISTSYPGVALMDYKKKGEEELDLVKDDALRVFKRYNHWSYAVKETGGDRGWVPSWFIGKVQTPSNPPSSAQLPAPANGAVLNLQTSSDEAVVQVQVSPMSSAFPLVQSRP
ncbi:hypothetical protein M378DRAFT_157663 [Amanita muscaria Koide BX008]|uniref:Uncharacterized protein n=1 Tax=Amanita muscaria (strain Koide BX008) TaxID=946122 RepID=A0A0C2XJZ4_AMAMK|nr:hypothetical protein M378DRAFT_157663 [Amanita muscaria Koide BX008]